LRLGALRWASTTEVLQAAILKALTAHNRAHHTIVVLVIDVSSGVAPDRWPRVQVLSWAGCQGALGQDSWPLHGGRFLVATI
jgi:hypothetical protein